MKLVDANVLIYAVDEGARHHVSAKRWLDEALRGGETVVMPWVCLLAFVRLTTHPSIYEHPLSTDEALSVVELWLSQPTVVVAEPGVEHVKRLRELLAATGRGGNLVNDAHIAAIAAHFNATVVTFDNDFARFAGVHWQSPA